MGIYKKIYEFSAAAGALEGYVYPKEKVDPKFLPAWVENIVKEYNAFTPDVRDEIQDECDRTLGRAIQSLIPILGGDHEVIIKLKSLIHGEIPSSQDDFSK